MSQISSIVATLKQEMKYQQIKYRDVAAHLDMNETSVRRLFSNESFSLERLEKICELVGMEISDLIYSMEANKKQIQELSLAQETELANDPSLLLVAHLAINGWQFQDIQQHYAFDDPQLISLLARLDKMGMIELMPMNRIKLRITEGFAWQAHGPVMAFFHRVLEKDFFNCKFEAHNEALLVLTGVLTEEANLELKQKIRELEALFLDISRRERKLSVDSRRHVGIVAAIRPMKFSIYDDIRK